MINAKIYWQSLLIKRCFLNLIQFFKFSFNSSFYKLCALGTHDPRCMGAFIPGNQLSVRLHVINFDIIFNFFAWINSAR